MYFCGGKLRIVRLRIQFGWKWIIHLDKCTPFLVLTWETLPKHLSWIGFFQVLIPTNIGTYHYLHYKFELPDHVRRCRCIFILSCVQAPGCVRDEITKPPAFDQVTMCTGLKYFMSEVSFLRADDRRIQVWWKGGDISHGTLPYVNLRPVRPWGPEQPRGAAEPQQARITPLRIYNIIE